MASIFRSRQLPQPRSGGKILRTRRTPTAKTPYDRPNSSNSASQSSNWLSRFVFLPTRSVATVAGKLLQSVFDLESSPTSSSSSSSGTDEVAEEEIGTLNDENNTPFQGDDALKKSGTSAVINFSGKELQPLVGNSKNKHVIDQLLMQETFSREECDMFIKIIRSRVVDSPANEVERYKRSSEMPNRTLGSGTDTPDLSSPAVMEAKKWLKEKNSGLGSKSDLGYGSHSLNLVTLPQALENEGSPVDVAKSYMRTLPPWASPSMDHINSPTPIGIQHFKEETPYLTSKNSTSSPKLKRDSPATGSWSIEDEIRRVRSRATEQMLMTLPSSKIDWSAFPVKYTKNVNSSAVENNEASVGEKGHNFTSSIDVSLNLTGGLSSQASPDLKRKWDGLQSEGVLSDPANISFEQNMASEAIQQSEGSQDDHREITTSGQKLRSSDEMMTMVHSDGDLVKVNGIDDTNGANHQLNSVEETREASDPRLHDGSSSVYKENDGGEDALANGFPSSGPSFQAGQVIEENTKTLDNKQSTVDSNHERIEKGLVERETCELLSETCLELPDVNLSDTVAVNEDNGVATGSQNSSSIQYEVQAVRSQPGSELDLAATTSSIAKKQKVKRITRYNRRGRGKGRDVK